MKFSGAAWVSCACVARRRVRRPVKVADTAVAAAEVVVARGSIPDSCGTINTSNAGRKLYAFLVASAELDRSSFELEHRRATRARRWRASSA